MTSLTGGVLLASEELLRTVWESTADGMALSDPQGVVLAANPAYYRLYGLTPERVIGQSFATIFPAEMRAWAEEQYRRVFTNPDQPATFESQVQRADGAPCVVESRADFVVRDGRRVAMLSVVRDITARKQAEAQREAAIGALRECEARFRVALQGAPITVFSQDRDLRYTWIYNPIMGDLRAEDFIGKTDAEVLPDAEAATQGMRHMRQVLDTGRAVRCELAYRVGGEVLHKDLVIEPQRDAAGHVTGIVCAAVDVTQMRHAAQERERLYEAETAARREAERQNELRLRFLGMISHELRTPLTSIKGFASTLQAEDVTWTEPERREYLAIIDAEADKLTEMIGQILDLSRIETGSLRIEPRAQTFNDILMAAQAHLIVLTAQHPLSISVGGALPRVRADGTRIAQVLANLVANAARYAPPGTPIDLQAEQTGDQVKVSVRDYGPGITSQDRPYVFEAFRRGSSEHTRQSKGAGLGLAICKGLVEAHGGRIWIEEHTGPGTVVSFTLPVID